MGIAHVPTVDEDLTKIRIVVTVGVLQVQGLSAVLYDDPAAMKRDRGGDAQFVGEGGELVGPLVAIGVLADANPITALACGFSSLG